MTLPHSRRFRNNVLRHFRTAHAPPAASNRSLRREWAAVANAAPKRTGDPDAAMWAGAEMLAAALESTVGSRQ
jgi:hypothetical protein